MSKQRQRRKVRKRREESRLERQHELMRRAAARRAEQAALHERRLRRILEADVAADVRAGRERAAAMEGRGRTGRPGETRPKSTDKDLDRLVAAAWDVGWQVERGGSDHVKVRRPDGVYVSVPMTPRGRRTLGRIRASLRQGGLDV